MARHRIGDKALSEPMLTRFTEAYMRHQGGWVEVGGGGGWVTHWGRVMHKCVGTLTIIGSDKRLTVPSHYLNQSWNTVNLPPGNKFGWNVNRKSYIFYQENAFENVICETSAIFSQPQWVDTMSNADKILYWRHSRCHYTIMTIHTLLSFLSRLPHVYSVWFSW